MDRHQENTSQVSFVGCGRKSESTRGFSLLEVVVVIGIVFLLLSLALPTVRNAKNRANHVADMSLLRQNGALAIAYTTDHKGVLPLAAHPLAFSASARWGDALVTSGAVPSLAVIDPAIAIDDPSPFTRHTLTLAAVFEASSMTQGATRDPLANPPSPIRVDQFVFPSQKGLLYTSQIDRGPTARFWCCTDTAPLGAVCMVDASVEPGYWFNYLPFPDREIENLIGKPVWSTWDGHRGRDR